MSERDPTGKVLLLFCPSPPCLPVIHPNPQLSLSHTHVSNRALEAIASGRAGGTAGPTLASFCTALVKTGGSGILMWAFFHGLQQMSAPEAAIGEAGGLPAAVDGDVGVLP